MGLVVSGAGDWGVLSDNTLALFPSREQAMVYVRWLIGMGLAPSLWAAV